MDHNQETKSDNRYDSMDLKQDRNQSDSRWDNITGIGHGSDWGKGHVYHPNDRSFFPPGYFQSAQFDFKYQDRTTTLPKPNRGTTNEPRPGTSAFLPPPLDQTPRTAAPTNLRSGSTDEWSKVKVPSIPQNVSTVTALDKLEALTKSSTKDTGDIKANAAAFVPGRGNHLPRGEWEDDDF
jgi:hypothetical protein